MSDKTSIEWTDATWNPVTGCTKVSPGCDHCYAETFAERWRGTPGHYFEGGFDLQLRPEKLDQPLRWKRPRRIFVNSMSDVFHEDIDDEYIAQIFAIMSLATQHTFQLLTKRHGRMRSLLKRAKDWDPKTRISWLGVVDNYREAYRPGCGDFQWPLPNVWLGVSAEDQRWADIRVPALLDTPAAVRFVSAEPLLGPIDFTCHLNGICSFCGGSGIGARSASIGGAKYGPTDCYHCGRGDRPPPALDWVIAGGESGHGARLMDLEWVRVIRDQCDEAGAAFLYKQQGSGDGGKKSRRELDGRTWDEFPPDHLTEVPF